MCKECYIVSSILILIILMSLLCVCRDVKKKYARRDAEEHEMIYGLPIDDHGFD